MRLLLLTVLWLPTLLFAGVEVGVGRCKLGLSERGSWWNDSYQTSIDLYGNCWELGFRKDWFRVGYLDLGGGGRFVNTMAARDVDQLQSPDGSNCNSSTLEGCIGRAVGKSHTYGITLGGVKDWGFLSTELGVFAYRSGVKISWQDQLGNKAYYDWAGYSATPYVGLGVTGKHWEVSARAFGDVKAHENGCGGCTGIAQGSAFSLMLRLR